MEEEADSKAKPFVPFDIAVYFLSVLAMVKPL